MKKLYIILLLTTMISCKNDSKTESSSSSNDREESNHLKDLPFKITPIQHASFILEWDDEVIYVDPSGSKSLFENKPEPSLIFITDIHGDHYDEELLVEIALDSKILAPRAVHKRMSENLQQKTTTIKNGEKKTIEDFVIEAIPMYNLTEDRKKYHEKGRGNGYVITNDDYNVYISGDTEDIPEMRTLEGIDLAFICMNLPYTMTPEIAADATLEFKPDHVIPYHYRGLKNGELYYYDTDKYKEYIKAVDKSIKVTQLDWYPTK